MSTIAVVVPIYQAQPTELEQFSLRHSLAQLKPGRMVLFAGPEGLDFSWYAANFAGATLIAFGSECFSSIEGYSRLLMSKAFYERFAPHEFILILQTDAILLRDELDDWITRHFDYVGAPWPDGIKGMVNLGNFANDLGGKTFKVHVGNGGFSLRRNQACIDLLAWLTAGTRLVIVVDPNTRTLHAYHGPDRVVVLREGESLDAGDVVPGVTISVAELFQG